LSPAHSIASSTAAYFQNCWNKLLRDMMTADAKATVWAFDNVSQDLDVSNLVPPEFQETASLMAGN